MFLQEVYNQDRSPEVDNVEGLASAANKYLEFNPYLSLCSEVYKYANVKTPDIC